MTSPDDAREQRVKTYDEDDDHEFTHATGSTVLRCIYLESSVSQSTLVFRNYPLFSPLIAVDVVSTDPSSY